MGGKAGDNCVDVVVMPEAVGWYQLLCGDGKTRR